MLAVVTSALAFQAPLMAPSRPAAASRTSMVQATVFDDGMSQFKADYPWLAKYGFGPSVKAERWNGRHAMFGWMAIILTGYAKGHGFFPDPTVALKYDQWGALTQMGFGEYISNERAIIMIAHIHALGVSMAAAFGPQVLGDSLTLLDGEVRSFTHSSSSDAAVAAAAAAALEQRRSASQQQCSSSSRSSSTGAAAAAAAAYTIVENSCADIHLFSLSLSRAIAG